MITLAIRSGYAELLDGEQPTGVRWKLDGDAAAGVRSFGDRYSDALGIEGPNAVARRRRELLDIVRELWSWLDRSETPGRSCSRCAVRSGRARTSPARRGIIARSLDPLPSPPDEPDREL